MSNTENVNIYNPSYIFLFIFFLFFNIFLLYHHFAHKKITSEYAPQKLLDDPIGQQDVPYTKTAPFRNRQTVANTRSSIYQ